MRIRFADGREFPLNEIADLSLKRGVIAINHIDGKREIKVEEEVANEKVSVSEMTAVIQNQIVPDVLKNYPTVKALFEGENREQERTTESMQLIMPVILLLMFFVIALTFRSISQTIAVFALIPFGFIGVGWGHFLMGDPISLFSILGVIALTGILVNDALVFVSTYNDNIVAGMKQMDAIRDTALSRFRPIVLTSITTFAGLVPLLFEKSLQVQFLVPMANSVAFGLLAVTFIILILLPVLIIMSNRIKVYSLYVWEGEMPSLESVEPATKGRKRHFFLWLIAGALCIAAFLSIIAVFFNVIN